MKTCENCRFYTPTGVFGECRRRSPIPYIDEDGERWQLWPTVTDDDWCGEWERPRHRVLQQFECDDNA